MAVYIVLYHEINFFIGILCLDMICSSFRYIIYISFRHASKDFDWWLQKQFLR
jgi:hypothetical protein